LSIFRLKVSRLLITNLLQTIKIQRVFTSTCFLFSSKALPEEGFVKENTNKKLFKSLLPVQKKFIPLYLLEKQLGGKINDTYIFGDIVRGSKIKFDGDKNIIIRDRIVPEIQYFNNTGKGKLY